MNETLKNQIEAAFGFRGHVTVKLTDGAAVEGYLYNRQFEEGYIELFVKNSDERRRLEIARISAVELTGEDYASAQQGPAH